VRRKEEKESLRREGKRGQQIERAEALGDERREPGQLKEHQPESRSEKQWATPASNLEPAVSNDHCEC
jgi:hypothetical protein